MDIAVHLLESLARGERFFSATSILHRQCSAFYDVEGVSRMIVPGTGLPGRYRKCSHRDCGRTVKELGLGNSANGKYDSACRISDDTKKTDDGEANYERQPVSQMIRFHVCTPFYFVDEELVLRTEL